MKNKNDKDDLKKLLGTLSPIEWVEEKERLDKSLEYLNRRGIESLRSVLSDGEKNWMEVHAGRFHLCFYPINGENIDFATFAIYKHHQEEFDENNNPKKERRRRFFSRALQFVIQKVIPEFLKK